MRYYVGIDPGAVGAIGVLDEHGRCVEVLALPMVPSSRKGREQPDVHEVKALLERYVIESTGEVYVALERLNAMPPKMGGTWTNHARGRTWIFDGLLIGMGISFTPVAPKTWQRVMHGATPAGDLKKRSIMAAKNQWPKGSLRRATPPGRMSRKDDDSLAAALLFAQW